MRDTEGERAESTEEAVRRRFHVLGKPSTVPADGWRQRMRKRPGVGHLYRLGVFLVGLLLIATGLALSVLPGPLTIPPVLLGLWIWSFEFAWAQQLLHQFAVKGREAWEQAKARPVTTTLFTVFGLVIAGVMIWAFQHYDVVNLAWSYVTGRG